MLVSYPSSQMTAAATVEVVINGAVEGNLDEAIARRLIAEVGAVPGSFYGRTGKQPLLKSVRGYNAAGRFEPWLAIIDMNTDAACAPLFVTASLPAPSKFMCLRVAVREIEAWLLADQAALARYLGVSGTVLPGQPEALDDPKRALVNIARRSRRRALREDIVPRQGSGRSEGPAYTSRFSEFVRSSWRPRVAAKSSDSLLRTLNCLESLTQRFSHCWA